MPKHLLNYLISFCLLSVLVSACNDKSQNPETQKRCVEGHINCSDLHHTATCKDGAYQKTDTCNINQVCSQSDPNANAVCMPPPNNFAKTSFFEQSLTNAEQLAKIVQAANSAACTLYLERLEKARTNQAQLKSKKISDTPKSLDAIQRAELFRCVFLELAQTTAKLTANIKEFERFENTVIKMNENKNEADYSLAFKGSFKKEEAADKKLSLKIMLTADAINGSAISPHLARSMSNNLRSYIFINLDSTRVSGLIPFKATLKSHLKKIELALSVFYFEDHFRQLSKIAVDSEVKKTILATFKGLNKHAEFFDCNEACVSEINKLDALLVKLQKFKHKEEPLKSLSAKELEILKSSKEAVFTLLFAEQLSTSSKINPPLALNQRIGSSLCLEVLSKILPPADYIDLLYLAGINTPASYANNLNGFIYANEQALSKFASQKLKDISSKSGGKLIYRSMLKSWINFDRANASKLIIKAYKKNKTNKQVRKLLIDTIGEQPTLVGMQFLLDRLRDLTITKRGLNQLLVNKKMRKQVIELLKSRLHKLDDQAARSAMWFAIMQLPKRDEDRPLALLPIIENLAKRSKNFLVYIEAREVLEKYKNKNWNWPERPPVVDRYVQYDQDNTNNLTRLNSAASGLSNATEELIVAIFKYSYKLSERAKTRMVTLLATAAKNNKSIIKVAKQISKMKATPIIAKMAGNIIKKSKKK